ncbi:MAG: integrase core domain-containing protein [Corynebacterium sp.]|uniref:integrase core domain-containing protein n=1 Tax=Corynebacterium sp. TaxID=1720 RepID=UPI0026DCECED|nr:integrase core domain-containing protein [Corynebacterium sp.]MDO5097156.1 integrase core domain-containing protein [Corynebacterium sp.]
MDRRRWKTIIEARTSVARWIEEVYNRQRRHSYLNMATPVDYENQHNHLKFAGNPRLLGLFRKNC